jgi:hypothetical protein
MSNNIEAKVVATTPRTMRKSRRSAARFKQMSSRPSHLERKFATL